MPKSGLRILHAIYSMTRGGAETQLSYLASELQKRGHDIHVAYARGSDEGDQNLSRLQEAGVTVHCLRSSGPYDPRIPLALYRLLARLAPDLVQSWLPMMDVVAGATALARGCPWVLSERNTSKLIQQDLQMRLRARMGRRADAVISNSKFGMGFWSEQTSDSCTRRVIRNALPLEELNVVVPAPSTVTGVHPGGRFVVSVGRFADQKNIRILLPAARLLVERSDVAVVMPGEGPLLEWARGFVKDAGLEDRILLPGLVVDVWSWIKAASVFVSASRFEGMPNSVMEAAALGCPLVVSDIPTHREILEREDALFVSCDDPEAIAGAVERVLSDEGLASSLSARGVSRSRGWAIETSADQYVSTYEEVVRRSRGET